jgi:hypothetical protein
LSIPKAKKSDKKGRKLDELGVGKGTPTATASSQKKRLPSAQTAGKSGTLLGHVEYNLLNQSVCRIEAY